MMKNDNDDDNGKWKMNKILWRSVNGHEEFKFTNTPGQV